MRVKVWLAVCCGLEQVSTGQNLDIEMGGSPDLVLGEGRGIQLFQNGFEQPAWADNRMELVQALVNVPFSVIPRMENRFPVKVCGNNSIMLFVSHLQTAEV